MKISQMEPKKQQKAIQQIAEKDQQMAKQVATMVKQVSSEQGGGQQGGGQEGPQPSQARQQQRQQFNQEIPGFEEGGDVTQYGDGGNLYRKEHIPNKAPKADDIPWLGYGDEEEAQFRSEAHMKNSGYSQPAVPLNKMKSDHTPDFDSGDGATKFSRKNKAYLGDMDYIENDPYISGNYQKTQPEKAKTIESDSSDSSSSSSEQTTDGSTDESSGGAADDELSDDSLKKIGALSQIAPDIFGLAQQSGEPNYMPRTTNPRTEDALGTMDDAIDQMPDEYDIRDARMRNERAYHAGMDQMYRNSRSAAVARGNQANAYAQKMRGTNKLNVQKNNKQAQYAQAEAQLLSNKSQMEQQAGAREAQYSANYHRNKLKADAKQRAIRQKYLSNIGTKTAYNTKAELMRRRDMDKVRINQESHTEDVQIGMDKLIQLLEEDKKKDNSDG